MSERRPLPPNPFTDTMEIPRIIDPIPDGIDDHLHDYDDLYDDYDEPDEIDDSADDIDDDHERDTPAIAFARKLGRQALKHTVGLIPKGVQKLRQHHEWNQVEKQHRELRANLDRNHAPERPLDKLVTDDLEILGESTHLKSEIHRNARNATNKIDSIITNHVLKHPGAKARDGYLEFRKNRIAAKIEKRERKIAANPDSWINKRRQKTVNMFKARKAWREGQMKSRDKMYAKRNDNLQNRKTSRQNKFEGQIDSSVNKRIEKMRERILKEKIEAATGHRNGNIKEKARFLASMTKEDKQKLTREAILAIRHENIKKGKLDWDYTVDPTAPTKKINDYEVRTQ